MRNTKRYATAKIAALLLALVWIASPAGALVLEVGANYVDAGATATDNYDGDITARVVTANTVKTAVLGSYTVTYSVTDSSGNAAAPSVRTVQVVDTKKPVITLVGSATMPVVLGSSFVDPGATAQDNYDGNLTAKIVKSGSVNTSVAGSYMLTYNVSDSSGNAATPVVRTVTVSADATKPVITLIGKALLTTKAGRPYVDPGATASDNVDGDITSRIVTVNPVKSSTPGFYTVTYDVKDPAGNAATTVKRTVRVTFWTKTDGDEDSLFIASPLDGSMYYASADMGTATLTLTASAPVGTESVEYVVDGIAVGSSINPPYTVATEIDPGKAGWGEHHVEATAKRAVSGETITAESTFTLLAVSSEDDANGNGIADNPFATLPWDGDAWSHTVVVPDTNGKRITGMFRFDGIDEGNDYDVPVVVVLGSGSDDAQRVVSVSVPRALLTVDETGVVIVQLAEDLDTLVGAEEAGLLLPEPDGHSFVKGGLYVEVSVLTSADGGLTFDEVDEARLKDHPVDVEMQGIEPVDGANVSLYKHPMFVDSDSTTGLMLISQEGSWSENGVNALTVDGDWVSARLTSLSLIAPYEPASKDETPAGCAGGSLNTTFSNSAIGDVLILTIALLTLLAGGGRAVARRARATQRP